MSPVDQDIYTEIAKVAGDDYAFSYFVKAKHIGNRITPHTVTAWERITARRDVMEVLRHHKITLVKPDRWSPTRDKPPGQHLSLVR